MEVSKMTKRILISLFVIALVIVASIGGTMAWFTDSAEVENSFEAGTVSIDVDEEWGVEGETLTDWNPGDCTPKLISVKYTGSKRAFLRVEIEQEWVNTDLPIDNVVWYAYIGEENLKDYIDKSGLKWKWNYPDTYDSFKDWVADPDEWEVFDLAGSDDWHYYNGWYYYDGGTDTEYTYKLGDDHIINAIQSGDPIWGEPLYLVSTVCLDGLNTDNRYQEETYSMKFTFQAIQASHSGEWNWDNFESYNPPTE